MKFFRLIRRGAHLLGFLMLGCVWFSVGVLFERTAQMKRVRPFFGPGPAALVQLGLARQKPRLAADFEPKSAVVIGANELIDQCPGVFLQLVRELRGEATLVALVGAPGQVRAGRELLAADGLPGDSVRFIVLPLNSMWVRDYGPLFVEDADGKVVAVDVEYRGADESGPRTRDDDLPRHLARIFGLPLRTLSLRFEGGNLLGNSSGLAVASTRLADDNLDAEHGIEDLRRTMARQLGVRRLCLLDPLRDEPTGHVDLYVAFLAPDMVLVGECDPETDPVNARMLDRAAESLDGIATAAGPLRVGRVPLLRADDGSWRSYCNVIMTDRKVLVPGFSDVDPAVEERALAAYRELMPDREVVRIESDPLRGRGGFLHCVSITVPAGVPVAERLGGTAGR